MRLINKTKNFILAENVFIADTFLKRMKGLIGRKVFPSGKAIILDPCNCVHTFFMHFPIDVIFVDKNYKVVKVLNKLSPDKITSLSWHSSKVIELPVGGSSLTAVQDQLQILY
ncbi:MAG: DUF192 domain-containing protein [Candidatus Omnitrophota bacterium]